MAIPASSASSFTGEKETSLPRPRGRSGCVNTPRISNSGWERSFLREGTANCGVPQNTMFRRFTRSPSARTGKLPLAFFPQLLDFAPDQIALQHAQMLQEKNSVQVIDFMAERARQEIFAANLERLALEVLRSHGDELRTNNVSTKPWNRKAAFLFADFPFGMDNFWIDQNDLCFRIFAVRNSDHRHPDALANLRRGQADALRGVHRSKHILGKLFELRVKLLDGGPGLFENRIAILHDRIDLARRRFGRLRGFHRCGGLRTRRFVGHSSRNSAVFRRANLLQIFAEKHRRAQVPPWPLRQHPRRAQRTNPNARRRPGRVPWLPCRRCRAVFSGSRSVSGSPGRPGLRRW